MRSPPMDPEMLEDFVAQIKSSRENALAGKYEDALVFYDGVLAQIQHRMKSELDAEMQRLGAVPSAAPTSPPPQTGTRALRTTSY